MWYFPLCRIPFTLQIKICVRCRPDRDKQRQKIVNGGDVFGEILFMRKNPSGRKKMLEPSPYIYLYYATLNLSITSDRHPHSR